MTGTDIQKAAEKQSLGQLVRAGANLPEDTWADARIAAVRNMLPPEMKDLPEAVQLAALIEFFSLAQRYDLDPAAGQVFGWWDPNAGQFVTMVGRDGLLRIADRDPDILGVTCDVVREGDKFLRRQAGDRVEIEHESNPFKGSGKIVGAWALVRRERGPDVFEAARVEQFSHLGNKKNWKQNGGIMVQTRCISAGLRKATPLVANIYVMEDFDLVERGPTGPEISPADKIVAALSPEEPVEAEAEVVEEEPETQADSDAEEEAGDEAAAEGDRKFTEFLDKAASKDEDEGPKDEDLPPGMTAAPAFVSDDQLPPGYYRTDDTKTGLTSLWADMGESRKDLPETALWSEQAGAWVNRVARPTSLENIYEAVARIVEEDAVTA
jgi:recombinational DNA repair protein RecT